MSDTLSRRALNRAMLDRQLLLRRSKMTALEAVEHLAGLQAQAPNPPYFALWTRLHGFRQEELANLLLDKSVVRIALMRGTVHLVKPADALAWRPIVQPLYDRSVLGNTQHGPDIKGLDHQEIARTARKLLGERPLSSAGLGAELAKQWEGVAPSSLVHVARALLPLVQIPPRGVWGKSGQPTYQTTGDWLGAEPDATPSPEAMFRRYLAAFGPASVQDAQAWAGITKLGDVAERLRPELRTFRDENGRELFDLEDAPRPDPDTPAPARLLGPFDQTVLSYADRTRVISDEHRKVVITQNGLVKGTILVGGFVKGFWEIKTVKKAASVVITPFERVPKRDLDTLEGSAHRLLRWAHPTAESHSVEIVAGNLD
ncbi:winged helix DNA-binding domain-containing protein [Amycolatopsis sp. NPDC057786]|uniref:winged helix DNA-binding domain-containing protein n=1 Tax=Amycolatopsis sp. NPDC057786 TaxID=3346250 RepID=UPI003670066F